METMRELTWRKATRSGSAGHCVEVAFDDGAIHVRDSKNQTGPALTFNRAEWAAFIGSTKDGEFDLPA